MQANPLWPVEQRFPHLTRNLRKEVLVVGGGMAGVSATFQLQKAGFDVALIERDEIGGPATGASSGVLYYGSGTNLAPAIKLFGEERASLLWKETAGVIDEIVRTAEGSGIDCGIRRCGSIMVAKTEEELTELDREFTALKRLGLPARLLSSGDVRSVFPLREFLGGVAFDAVGQVHPARLAAAIVKLNDLEVYEGTPLESWEEKGGMVEAVTPAGVVGCSRIVFATNAEPLLGLENHFDLESSVILASEPTERVADIFPTEKIFWSMEERYDLVYPRGDRLILELYGLGDEESKLSYYFPGIEFKVEQQWGESWAKPPDWFPIVGKVSDDTFVAVGMGDQGIIMSWLSGSKIPGILNGKTDWFAEAASPGRFGNSRDGTNREAV